LLAWFDPPLLFDLLLAAPRPELLAVEADCGATIDIPMFMAMSCESMVNMANGELSALRTDACGMPNGPPYPVDMPLLEAPTPPEELYGEPPAFTKTPMREFASESDAAADVGGCVEVGIES
jgi:hypothetical protein